MPTITESEKKGESVYFTKNKTVNISEKITKWDMQKATSETTASQAIHSLWQNQESKEANLTCIKLKKQQEQNEICQNHERDISYW